MNADRQQELPGKDMTPDEVARAVDGKLMCVLRMPTKSIEIHRGYYALRKMALWASRQSEKDIPPEIKYTLRWLREGFGFKKDRTGEVV